MNAADLDVLIHVKARPGSRSCLATAAQQTVRRISVIRPLRGGGARAAVCAQGHGCVLLGFHRI